MPRGGGSMPALSQVALYWSEGFGSSENRVIETFGQKFRSLYIGWGEPFCFACGWLAPVDDTAPPAESWGDAASWLERAHIVPVFQGGDNSVRNLLPLCRSCHKSIDKRVMSGEISGRKQFISSVMSQPRCSSAEQRYTDFLYGEHEGNAQAALEWIEGQSIWRKKAFWWPLSDSIVLVEFGKENIPHDLPEDFVS